MPKTDTRLNGSNGHNGKQKVTDSTPVWEQAFLAALEESGVILKAAAAAEVSRKTVWLRRKTNTEFAIAFEDALKAGALLLEAEAIRRAQDGVVRMKFNSKTGLPFIDPRTGEPYMEHEYSDTLMAILLKRHFPEYREKQTEVNTNVSVHNYVVPPEKVKAIRERHAKAIAGYGR